MHIALEEYYRMANGLRAEIKAAEAATAARRPESEALRELADKMLEIKRHYFDCGACGGVFGMCSIGAGRFERAMHAFVVEEKKAHALLEARK